MINALSTSLDLEQKARQVDKQELCFGVIESKIDQPTDQTMNALSQG